MLGRADGGAGGGRPPPDRRPRPALCLLLVRSACISTVSHDASTDAVMLAALTALSCKRHITSRCKGDHIRKVVLTVPCRYNFMPLARGSAVVGAMTVLAVFMAAGMPVTASIPPVRLQSPRCRMQPGC